MNISMFPHVGSGNHGCEAIIRSTIELLRDYKIIVFTDNPEQDRKYMPNIPVQLMSATSEIQRFTRRHFQATFQKYIGKQRDAFERETYAPLLRCCKKGDILLSSGGDLYCYDAPNYIYHVNRYVREQGCKTVLWGCSVEPSCIDDQMKVDLAKYDLICARETITYETLKTINPHTILTVDPAFVLPMERVKLPASRYIGVNVSPMIVKREKVHGMTLENYRCMIQYILDHTEDTVALIPHVIWTTNDDRDTLKKLKAAFIDNDRVVMVDDHNAVQQKYIISHCRMFIGARTHATIAAYSSCVPTLVVGYSVKAKGIAKDLFGDYENYVLPVQSLKEPENLTKAFSWLMRHENKIRMHLKQIMPDYIQRTQLAVEAINQLES